MPALRVMRSGGDGGTTRRRRRGLTTRPFAGDDLQILCVIMAAYRVVQIACIVPFWIRILLFRLHGRNFVGPNGRPSWCIGDIDASTFNFTLSSGNSSLSKEGYRSGLTSRDTLLSFTVYLVVSFVYMVLDVVLSLAIWSAACVGTPVEPRGRDKALRSLVWIKMVFMNVLLAGAIASGIYFVAEGRGANYGCGEDGTAKERFEKYLLL